VVVRALREQLVLDMDAGDPGGGELAHSAHRVQRFAEPRSGVGDQRHRDGARDFARHAHLLVHRQQRLGDGAGGARRIAAGVDELRPRGLRQLALDRRRRRRHVEELTRREQGAQLLGLCTHGPFPPELKAPEGRVNVTRLAIQSPRQHREVLGKRLACRQETGELLFRRILWIVHARRDRNKCGHRLAIEEHGTRPQ